MSRNVTIAAMVIVLALVVYGIYRNSSEPTAETTVATSTDAQSRAGDQTSATANTSKAASATAGQTSVAPGVELPASQVIPAKSLTVKISNFAFSPKSIVVAPGTRVTWINEDSAEHTVDSAPGGPSSGQLSRGQSYSFTFKNVGIYNYHCANHPGMTGTVTVTQ